MLYIPWKLEDKRTTMDLDLLGFGSPDVENLSRIFRRICDVEMADDGLVFDKESVTATPIREEKDYFDIWMLSRNFTFEGEVLREALSQTFAKRQTALPNTEPIGLSDEFASNESKRRQWQGFVHRQWKQDSLPDLTEIVAAIRDFLMPIVSAIGDITPSPEST